MSDLPKGLKVLLLALLQLAGFFVIAAIVLTALGGF